jgi:hypothetical protein
MESVVFNLFANHFPPLFWLSLLIFFYGNLQFNFLVGRLNFPQLHVGVIFPFQANNSFAFAALTRFCSHQELA